MDAGKINAVLLNAMENGVVNRSKKIAIVKITPELKSALNNADDIIHYRNDWEDVKTKSNIIIELMMDMASNDAWYEPKDIKCAINILQELGEDIKKLEVYYNQNMPAILATYDSNIAVVVKLSHAEYVTDGVITPVEVFSLV